MKTKLQEMARQIRQYVIALRQLCREGFVHHGKPMARHDSVKPWWRYDVSEALEHLKRIRFSKSFLEFSVNLKDIGRWSGGVRIGILGVCCVIAFGITGFLFWPLQMSAHRALENERLLLETRYLRQKQMVDEAPYYKQQIDGILHQFGSLLDAVPETLEPVHVLTMINQAANTSGVRLEGFKPLKEEVDTYYAVLPVEIRLAGDFHGLAKFMEQVSRMQHLVAVDVAIVPSATHEEQLVLASLLRAYRYQPPGKTTD